MTTAKAATDVQSPTWKSVFALLIDLLALVGTAFLIFLATSWALLPEGLVWSLVAVVALLALSGLAWWRTRYGSSVGALLFGIRAIDPATGLPPRRFGFAAVDLRAGADPLRPEPRPFALDTVPLRQHAAGQADRPVLVGLLDDGSRHRIPVPCVLGRDPVAMDGANRFMITDFDRTVSRTHLAIWIDGGALAIRDLGSLGGTVVSTSEGDFAVGRQTTMRVPLSLGSIATLKLGRRRLEIEAVPSSQAPR